MLVRELPGYREKCDFLTVKELSNIDARKDILEKVIILGSKLAKIFFLAVLACP